MHYLKSFTFKIILYWNRLEASLLASWQLTIRTLNLCPTGFLNRNLEAQNFKLLVKLPIFTSGQDGKLACSLRVISQTKVIQAMDEERGETDVPGGFME